MKIIEDKEKLENELKEFINNEKIKIDVSIHIYIKENNQRGLSQMIGRRYGYIWENITSIILKNDSEINLTGNIYYNEYLNFWINEHSIHINKECCRESSQKLLLKFLEETTGTSTQDLCDYSFEYNNIKYAIDTKYRFNSNDSKTVREIANSANHLKEMGYIPILLMKRNKIESQQAPIRKFEKEGWTILDEKKAFSFLYEITKYNLEEWIKENLNIWDYLKDYHNELEKLRYGKNEWKF